VTDPSIIADFDKWLHAVANRLTDEAHHDDLVQEGRVAMWRALQTYDESLGALPSWLVRAAEMRMKDVAWGRGQPFGHEAVRGVREVDMGPSVDELSEQQVEALMGFVEEAFHDGEVLRVIRERLTPRQQEYVFLRFWGGLDPSSRAPGMQALVAQFPVLKERWHWQRAKPVLAEALAHRRDWAA
jgi:RNA polymerase sigma factor (sigma-70 family)